jgi:hypothetical protein
MDPFDRAHRSSLDMAQEHSDSERENRDSHAERTAGASASPVPEHYNSALSELNMLDAPNGAGKSKVEAASEPPSEKGGRFQSSRETIEIISAGAAPTTNSDSALALLSELCALGEEKTPTAAGAPRQPPEKSPDSGASGEKPEIAIAANDAAATSLNEPGAAGQPREQKGDSASEYQRRKPNLEARRDWPDMVSIDPAAADYYSALLQVIESAANDPRELRRLVYELARTSLQKDPDQGGSAPTPDDVRDLETAIARVEVDLSRMEHSDIRLSRLDAGPQHLDDGLAQEQLPATMSWLVARNRSNEIEEASVVPLRLERSRTGALGRRPKWPSRRHVLRPETAGSRRGGSGAPSGGPGAVEIVYPEREAADAVRVRRRVWLWFIVWPLVQLIGLASFCFALYVGVSSRLDVQEARTHQATLAEPQQLPQAETARPSGLPLPSTYGVYAISGGSLNELQPLPIRAPDPRVQLSAEISKPSSSILPDGKIAFILFRRDLVNSAPQKISIRVVARVASALTVSSGRAATLKPEASWHIRGNSYDFPVSPLNENREMVVARPEDPDFAFPAGRYALVFEGLAYDFTVDGPITDPAQCLESFEAVNGSVFSQCGPK